MEVHELKEVLDQRFDDLNKHLTSCFVNIDTKTMATDLEIKSIKETVISHDRWLWAMRGIVGIIVVLIGWLGIKIRF